jgi:hypothetical protein
MFKLVLAHLNRTEKDILLSSLTSSDASFNWTTTLLFD